MDTLLTALGLLAQTESSPTLTIIGGAIDPDAPATWTDILLEVAAWTAFAVVVAGVVVWAMKQMRARPSPDATAAEAAFEAEVMGQFAGTEEGTPRGGKAGRRPTPSELPRIDDEVFERTWGGSGSGRLAGADGGDDAVEHLAPTRDAGNDEDPQRFAPEVARSPITPSIKLVIARLRALKPDLAEIGAIAPGSPESGRGVAVAWNKRRETAALFEALPIASDMPGLLKRFDLVIVAPPGGDGEPYVIDRLGAYFMRGVSMPTAAK